MNDDIRPGCVSSNLPAERPEDFVIEWTEGGGENPDGSQAVIAGGEGVWTFITYSSGRREETPYRFEVTQDEFDALYEILRENKVDTIREMKREIYDGDEAGIAVRWGDHAVSIWGLGVIDEDQARYQRVYSAARNFLEEKVPDHP